MTDSILKATDLTKIFPHPFKEDTNIPVFAKASFEMTSSKLNFLVGASGSGKTTLLRILLGIEAINAGELYFDELPIYRLKGKEKIEYLKKVGYMDQFPAKFLSMHFSAKKNLDFSLVLHGKFPKEERNKMILETVRNFGLEKQLDEKTLHLSGGELRRLSLACNMIFNPDLLLCDEPTSQLDAQSKSMVMDYIQKLTDTYHSLIVISTHDKSIIKDNPVFEIKRGLITKWES